MTQGAAGPRPPLWINADGKLRLRIAAGGLDHDLAVTEVRLYKADLTTPSASAAAHVQSLITRSADTVVGLGLTRASPREAPKHWLQVTSVYPLEDPFWDRQAI